MTVLYEILRSWAQTESSVSSMQEIHDWIEERKANTRVVIEKAPFPEGGFWFFDPKDGFIRNRNNSFFQIAGYRKTIGDRIVTEQPVILQQFPALPIRLTHAQISFLVVLTFDQAP